MKNIFLLLITLSFAMVAKDNDIEAVEKAILKMYEV